MSWHEKTRWDFKEFGQQMSMAGLWSYRGKLWKKYAGSYPYPKDVDMEPKHPFFDPDVVCHIQTIGSSGKVLSEEWRHHGRKLKPGDRLYPQ